MNFPVTFFARLVCLGFLESMVYGGLLLLFPMGHFFSYFEALVWGITTEPIIFFPDVLRLVP